MRSRSVIFLFVTGLGGSVAAQPDVRDHRRGRPTMAAPTEAPPPAPDERFVPRRGQVWVPGAYEWRRGQWVWKQGHYEGRKRNKRFNQGRWENKGGNWEWSGGGWVKAPTEQEPPPAEVVETPQRRRGHVWVKGYWEFKDGSYDFVPGRLQRRERGKQWQDGRWDNTGGRWTWTAGTWTQAPAQPTAPPAPLEEKRQFARGQVWVNGYWEFNDGGYDWVPGRLQRRQRGQQWQDGRWDNTGGRWTWTAGTWSQAPAEPTAPPPALEEKRQFRRGMVWVAGHWEWQNGGFDWVPGKLERRQRGKRFREGKWDNTGGKWNWSAGTWSDAPAQQDAPPAAIVETAQPPRRGFVWVAGNYDWRDGDYEWVPGHWERERAAKRWVDGRWDNTGGKWTWTAGVWL